MARVRKLRSGQDAVAVVGEFSDRELVRPLRKLLPEVEDQGLITLAEDRSGRLDSE